MKPRRATLEGVLSQLSDTLPQLADETCTRIYRDLESYAGVDRVALESSVARNLGIALAALRAGAAPTPESLDEATQTARERHEKHVPVEELIRAFRVSIALIHETFVDLGLSLGLGATDLIAGSRVLWTVGDSFTTRVVTTYHALDIEEALADASRRTAAVRALLAGQLPSDPSVYALDPQRSYAVVHCAIPAGANAESLRMALERTGSLPDAPALIVLDSDTCLGLVATRPHDPTGGAAVGLGPFVQLEEMPRSDRAARVALRIAARLGRRGVQGTQELGWRLAAAARPDVWRSYADTFLTPLHDEGGFENDILLAVRAWLHHGRSMQRAADALTVHVNTVRYRLAKYEELTGFDMDDPDDVVGLTWALELGDPDVDPL